MRWKWALSIIAGTHDAILVTSKYLNLLNLKLRIMKSLTIERMYEIEGGSNRQCLIDGALTVVVMGLGAAAGGWVGMFAGLAGGLYAGNSNGCFE